MKSLYFNKYFSLREIPQPGPVPGEVLIKVKIAGICNTDKEIAQEYMNFTGVPGHEFVGIVKYCEDDNWVGRRVVGEINCGCGNCFFCQEGLERHCPQRTVLGISGRNGAFAEYLTLPWKNLHPVPDNLPDEIAVFTEPLASACEIGEQLDLSEYENILIIGDGKLSALIAIYFQTRNLNFTVLGINREKLKLFQSWGINIIPNFLIPQFPNSQIPNPDSYDLVVEASGHPSGWNTALSAIKPRGTMVLKSTYHGSLDFNPAPLVINEITLVGSRCGKFPPALKILEQQQDKIASLITRTFPFDNILEAFECANRPDSMKVLIKI
jgi:threonine dehydrogenase-like Zn-dependent dehydrogenase